MSDANIRHFAAAGAVDPAQADLARKHNLRHQAMLMAQNILRDTQDQTKIIEAAREIVRFLEEG